jgi:hypothetical protein
VKVSRDGGVVRVEPDNDAEEYEVAQALVAVLDDGEQIDITTAGRGRTFELPAALWERISLADENEGQAEPEPEPAPEPEPEPASAPGPVEAKAAARRGRRTAKGGQ